MENGLGTIIRWRTIKERTAKGVRSQWVETSDDKNDYEVKRITPISFIVGQEVVAKKDYENRRALAAIESYWRKVGGRPKNRKP